MTINLKVRVIKGMMLTLFSMGFLGWINAQELPVDKEINLPANTDGANPKAIVADSISTSTIQLKEIDSTLTDSIQQKKEFLSDKVNYKAADYVAINRKENKIRLYNKAEVYYEDMEIKSGIITIDYNKSEIYAGRIKDSTGQYVQPPVFKQGREVVEPDSIKFNFDTEKALIFNSKTEQSGFHILGERTKKENDSVVFMSKARFTTSETPEDPEYYFQTKKIKFVPKKKIVVGPTNMVIEDVPTIIGVPFGFFPMTEKHTSGILFPTYGEQNSRGYFLQNGGYYFALSDYADLAVVGDYYTNGSYGFRMETNYAWRYKFRGNLSFRLEHLISGEKGFSGYSKTRIYNIRWSHSQDAKSSPNARFSASVNLGSSKYYQQSINQLNVPNFLNNNLSSSISYSKTFQGEPQVNLSATVTHSQNTNTESINMTLPSFNGSVSRVFPFAPKTGVKKGFLHNINLQYNLRADNRIQTTDSLFFKKEMFKAAKSGIQHSIPLSTNFKLLKHFSLSASTNFQEVWTFKTLKKNYDPIQDKIVETELHGFDAFRTYNFSMGLGTTLYGMFPFEKSGQDKKIKAIRHVLRPSISYSINPTFDQYYETVIADADGTTLEEYSRFENSIFGTPNKTYSSNIGLSLSNTFEAKVRDKDSTKVEPKKITLLNNLNFSTSYNLAADSLKLSPIRMSGGTQLFDNKLGVNFNAGLDPYALNNKNQRIDKLNINNGGSLLRITSANISMNYALSSDSFKSGDDSASQRESARSGGRTDDLFGKAQDFSDRNFSNTTPPDRSEENKEFYQYKIPWSLRLAYTINYSNARRQDEISSHSLMFSGDIELSPRWSLGGSSGYDFKNRGFTYTQLRFERDLLSWRMNFSWVPFSARTSWFFFIGIKSNLLRDIKYEKRKQPDQQL